MKKKQISEKWSKLEDSLLLQKCNKEKVISSLKSLYDIYEPSLLGWLGGLFDSDIGGFYYSNSARDGEKFFPDIESTGQAIGILEVSGAISSYRDIPESVRSKIACYVCSCEDPQSGYFYNQQWSKEDVDKNYARIGRDSRWAVDLAQMCNFEISCPTVFSKLRSGNTEAIPEYLLSETNFNKYLDSFNWTTDVYHSIHHIASQFDQIRDAGLEKIALNHLTSIQNKETGLFGTEQLDDVTSVKVLEGVVSFFKALNKPIPNAEKIVSYVLSVASRCAAKDMSYFSSVWGVVAKVVRSTIELNGKNGLAEAEKILLDHMQDIENTILYTIEELKRFKKPDGSFSYLEQSSSHMSQGMIIAKENSFEGDVNGTILAVSIPNNIVTLLSLKDDFIPIYSFDDFKMFLKNVE